MSTGVRQWRTVYWFGVGCCVVFYLGTNFNKLVSFSDKFGYKYLRNGYIAWVLVINWCTFDLYLMYIFYKMWYIVAFCVSSCGVHW